MFKGWGGCLCGWDYIPKKYFGTTNIAKLSQSPSLTQLNDFHDFEDNPKSLRDLEISKHSSRSTFVEC